MKAGSNLLTELGAMSMAALTNAGIRHFHVTNSTFRTVNGQPRLRQLHIDYRSESFQPPQPSDLADPDALHRFIERAKSRRVDTF
jgi:hypothetical protein